MRGSKHFNWRGGRYIAKSGYIFIYRPNHPCSNRGYVYEHRVIMEEKLGRYLVDGEVVHHINGNKQDNRIENLELLSSQATHMSLEHTLKFWSKSSR